MLKEIVGQVLFLWNDLNKRFHKRHHQDDDFVAELQQMNVSSDVEPPQETNFFELASAPTNSLNTLHKFLSKNPELAHRFLLKKISHAIKFNLSSLELFRVGNTPIVARVEEKDYEMMLTDAQNFFIEKEEFEMADKCQHLKDQYNINKLLKSTEKK